MTKLLLLPICREIACRMMLNMQMDVLVTSNSKTLHKHYVFIQAMDPDLDDDYDNPDRIRHAETPELAREALIDSAALIFKSQVLLL